jgi:DNA ligase-1
MSLLADLVAVSRRVGETASRKAKIGAIAQWLRTLPVNEIGLGVAYLSGETRQGRSGIGYALIRDASESPRSDTPRLSLADVDAALEEIAGMQGAGSLSRRARRLADVFASATAAEHDFLVRLLLGELRQGALEGLMIEAVASAAQLPAAEVRRAAMIAGGVSAIAPVALSEGAPGLRRYSIELFRPLAPMLAQSADDIAEAVAALPDAALEWKLDGARVQVHKGDGEVRIYTRTGNEVTPAAPEVVSAVQELPARSLILDGETIALEPDGAPLPFQETMRRFGRVLDIDAMREVRPLSVFFFDCLRLDDADLVALPARERFEAMRTALPPSMSIPRIVAGEVAAAQAFYDDTVARGHEGVMVKALDSVYEPGARSACWLKVKRAHTLDLVVLAAEWGNGRRRGWLSNLHLGARDPATGSFVMLGKTFKGMTDAMLEWQTGELLAREVGREGATVHVRPELVVEIAFNDLQASSRYPGGLALRFARVKGYRPDKRPEEADTIDTVRRIYASGTAGHPPA